MKKACCLGVVLALLQILVSGAVGAPQRGRSRVSKGGTRISGFQPGQGPHIGGRFGKTRGSSFFFGTRHRAFGPSRALADPSPQERWFPGFAPYGGWLTPRTQLSSRSDRFVREWVAKEPVSTRPESPFSDLSQSQLLRLDMNDDEVVLAVGSPVTRTNSGSSEIWTFSGFELLFTEGRLQGIR